MSKKFFHYLNRSNKLNKEEEKDLVSFVENFDEITKSKEYFEDDYSLPLSQHIKLIIESEQSELDKAKNMFSMLIKNKIDNEMAAKRLMTAFGVDKEIKSKVIALFKENKGEA